MVQIPTARDVGYAGTRSGRIAPNGPSVSVGAAMAGAGQDLVRSAFNLQDLADRERQDVLSDRSNSVSTAMTKFLGDEEQRFLKAQDDSSESGIGFTRSYLEGWQQRADDFAKSNFEGLNDDEQTRYRNMLISRGNDLYTKADSFESKQKGTYYDRTTNQSLDTIRTQIRANSADYGQLKEQGLASINSTNMPESWKAARRAEWDADAAESKWKWKFEKSPAAAISELMAPAGSNVGRAYQRLLSKGWAPHQAAGIVGNLTAESGSSLNTKALNAGDGSDGSDSIGIAQWNGQRAQALRSFAASRGTDWHDLDTQVDFIDYELRNNERQAGENLARSTNAEEAAAAFTGYERPAGWSAGNARGSHNWQGRRDAALKIAGENPAAEDGDFNAIPYDRRETLINWGEGEYTRQQNVAKQEARGSIETAVANAPAAIQNTGTYQNPMPGQDRFTFAYGPVEGAQRYNEFKAAVDTSQQAFKFQTMPEADIAAIVKGAEPTSTGDTATLDTKKYDALTKAAAETIKAREADPATYVQRTFPAVAQAWTDAGQSGNYSDAMSMMASTQRQLGIRNMQLLPKQVADTAVTNFKNVEASGQDRLGSVAGLVFSTSDQSQRQAVYKQLVDAGMPASMDGVFEAMARGDKGAANRLMEAVVTDVGKLPTSKDTTPATITDSIYSDVWAPGEIGYTAYGLSYGDASSLDRAQRGTELLNKAVRLRMSRGEDMQTAISGAKKDLFGDKVVYTGSGYVNADLAVDSQVDQTALTDGLIAAKDDFKRALNAQRTSLLAASAGGDASQNAIVEATTENRVNDILTNGVFVQTGNGIGLRDPYTGQFVSGADGKPLTIPMQTILAPKPDAKSTARNPAIGSRPGAASDLFAPTFENMGAQ